MRRIAIWTFISTLLCLACLFGAGCEKKVLAPTPAQEPELMSTSRLAGEANQAWMRRDYEKSELFYGRLVERPGLDEGLRLTATKRLALSACQAGHYHQALESLKSWKSLFPADRVDPEWAACYVQTLLKLKRADLLDDFFLRITADPATDPALAVKTGTGLASLYWELDRHGKALETLRTLYAFLGSPQARAALEQRLRSKFEAAPTDQLELFNRFVTPDNTLAFPYALVAFENARRKVRTLDEEALAEQWPSLWRTMSQTAANSELEERASMLSELMELEQKLGVPRQGVALLLPLSGRYAPVSWKILKGAGAAQWRMSQSGADLEVEIINTEVPGFEQRLRDLPAYFGVVGGPLRRESLETLMDAQALKDRALFAFMPKLPEGVEEGQGLWRFFTSPSDQIQSLLNLTMGKLNATRFAVLHPQEPYGRRMSQIFTENVIARNGTITASQSYNPSDPPSWGDRIEKLVHTVNATNTTAVFNPDAFSRSKLLIPYFFFFNEGRVLFLGPEMWSQALSKDQDVDMQYMSLAVCPGSWWPESPGARKLAEVLAEDGVGPPDYWSALGFDFIRVVERIGALPPGRRSEAVNERLADANSMEFSLAPFVWNATGHVRQDLYLFQPTRNGKDLLNPDRLDYRIKQALEAHEWRIETLQKEQEGQSGDVEEEGLTPESIPPALR